MKGHWTWSVKWRLYRPERHSVLMCVYRLLLPDIQRILFHTNAERVARERNISHDVCFALRITRPSAWGRLKLVRFSCDGCVWKYFNAGFLTRIASQHISRFYSEKIICGQQIHQSYIYTFINIVYLTSPINQRHHKMFIKARYFSLHIISITNHHRQH